MKKMTIILLSVLFIASCSDEYKINALNGDPINLPSDPGMAGKQSIAGIDSNNNGVRDDLERSIYFKYPKDKQKRQLLYQIAKQLQSEIEIGAAPGRNQVAITNAWHQIGRYISCRRIVLKENDDNYDYVKNFSIFLENLAINTLDRYKAKQAFKEKSNGMGFTSKTNDDITDCDMLGD